LGVEIWFAFLCYRGRSVLAGLGNEELFPRKCRLGRLLPAAKPILLFQHSGCSDLLVDLEEEYMKITKCPECGLTAVEHFKDQDGFMNVKCANCGFLSSYVRFLPCGHCELEKQKHS